MDLGNRYSPGGGNVKCWARNIEEVLYHTSLSLGLQVLAPMETGRDSVLGACVGLRGTFWWWCNCVEF